MISQYANSPKYVKLYTGLSDLFNNASTLEDWFNVVYNLNTATGFGLDIWGKILNQGRQFTYFENGSEVNVYLGGEQTIDGVTYSEEYMENTYRLVLFLKALTNITNCTIASMNSLLQFYFKNRGRVYVLEYNPMEIRYVFEFYVSKIEKAIFTTDVMPKPTGVGISFEFIPAGEYFGFFVNDNNIYKGTWIATGQTDYSSIPLPVSAGDMYKVSGQTTIGDIDWSPDYRLVITKSIASGGTITSNDVTYEIIQPYAPFDQKPFYR